VASTDSYEAVYEGTESITHAIDTVANHEINAKEFGMQVRAFPAEFLSAAPLPGTPDTDHQEPKSHCQFKNDFLYEYKYVTFREMRSSVASFRGTTNNYPGQAAPKTVRAGVFHQDPNRINGPLQRQQALAEQLTRLVSEYVDNADKSNSPGANSRSNVL